MSPAWRQSFPATENRLAADRFTPHRFTPHRLDAVIREVIGGDDIPDGLRRPR